MSEEHPYNPDADPELDHAQDDVPLGTAPAKPEPGAPDESIEDDSEGEDG